MTKLKSFLKSFTPYQIIYLLVVLVLIGAFVFLFPDLMLEEEVLLAGGGFLIFISVVDALANPLCELLIAKQSKWNFIVDLILVEIPELILCFYFGWYATAATIIIFWIPVSAISFIRWNNHLDKEDENLTVVKKLKGWQTTLATLGIIIFGVVVGYLLQFVPGATDSTLDAFASAFGLANGILLLLRYNEQWIAWLITVLITIVLDIRAESYILLISEGAMLVNTIYGIVKWYKYTKKQKLNQ